jgi:hypothetical protein
MTPHRQDKIAKTIVWFLALAIAAAIIVGIAVEVRG